MLSAVRKGLSSVFGFDRRMEEQEFEDGEFRPDQEMDPDFLSSIEERLEALFGPQREHFDCELSANKLGARFGGYGTFLLDGLSCPPSPVELSTPGGALNVNATLSVLEEPPNPHGTLNHNDYTILEKPTFPLGTLESSVGAFQNYSVPITSSPKENGLDVTGEHPPESQHALDESPETILQIMTYFPIPGGQILTPLPESVLQLRRVLPSVLRSDQAVRMEDQEMEEGEFLLSQKENSSMDPKSLSYNEEWIEALFGGESECQLSAENFGDKFGEYGTFLLDGLSCPSLVELSSPEGALNENATLSVPQKPPNLHGALNHNDSTIPEKPSCPRGTLESFERSFQKSSVPAGFPSSTNENGLDGSGEHPPESQHALDESPGTILQIMTSFSIPGDHILSPLSESILQLRRETSVLGSDQAVRMEDQEMEEGELPPSQKENSSMDPQSLSNNGSYQDPSIRTCISMCKNDCGPTVFAKDDDLDGSREHHPVSHYFLDESPGTIIQIMTSLPVPGGHLISPLSENVLQLKKGESDDKSPLLQPFVISPQVWPLELSTSHIPEAHLSNVNEYPSGKSLLKKVTLKQTSMALEKQIKDKKKVSTQYAAEGDFVGNNDKCSKSKNKREGDHYVFRPCKKLKKEDLIKDCHSMLEVPGPYVKKRKKQSSFEIDGSVDLPGKRWKQTTALCMKETRTNLKPCVDIGGIKVADFPRKQKVPSRKFVTRKRSQAEDGSHGNSIHHIELRDESYGAREKDAMNQCGKKITSIKCNVGRKDGSSNNGVPKNVDSGPSRLPKLQKDFGSSVAATSCRQEIHQYDPSKRDKKPFPSSHSKGGGHTKVAFGRGTSKLILPSGIIPEVQTRCRQVSQKHVNSVRCSTDALKVVQGSNLQNVPREDTPKGSEALGLMRKDGATDATTTFNEARRLKHFAESLKSDGSVLERTDLYFEAALKFLYVASVLELPITGNAKQGGSSQSVQLYADTARMFEFCAHEYERCKQMAAAALAYKCVEVTYMKVAFLKHPSARKDQHGLEQTLQTNAIATTQIGPDFMRRLLSYTNALNSAFEATKKCQSAISELASDADDLMSSVKEVLKFNFHNVDGFLRLLRPSMASVRR